MKRTTVWALCTMGMALILVAGTALAGSGRAAALDGKKFEIQLEDPNAENPMPDTLIFAEGMFDSTACHKYGFSQSTYTAKPEGSAVKFEVRANSKTDGKQVWNGTVQGDRIHGTMKWTDAQGKTTLYRFQGQLHAS